MKSTRRTIRASALASVCLLVGCATHPLATVGPSSPVASAKSQSMVVQPIFASDADPTAPVSPQDTSKLPPGHPNVSSQNTAPSGALPPGHPSVNQAAGTHASASQNPGGALPAGHPSVGSAAPPAQNSALPPGHPSLNGAAPSAPASTQPVIAGTLTIHAVQSTAGGPAVGADAVSIDMVSSTTGQLISHSDSHLNADGTLDIKGFDVRNGVEPIVDITHAGVVFSAGGNVMDPEHAVQKFDVPVYETTEQAPDWSIAMRHVIVQPSPAGLDVMEMFSIESKGDRAWIGKADAKGQRSTFTLTLPPGLTDLKIGGSLDTTSVNVADGKLVSRQPIAPGAERYEIEYTIPARADKAVVTVTAPSKVGNMLVLVPDDGTTVDAAGLQAMGAQQLGQQGPKTRCYMGNALNEGQIVTLTIGNLKSSATTQPVASNDDPQVQSSAPEAAATAEAPASTSMVSRGIAVGGGLAILLVGTVITLMKTPKPARKAKHA